VTRVVEDTPSLSIRQVRASPQWPRIRKVGRVRIVVVVDGRQQTLRIKLATTPSHGCVCHWLECPVCGTPRGNLYIVGDRLACRFCHGLNYYIQAAPRSTWKREVLTPLARELGGLNRAAASS